MRFTMLVLNLLIVFIYLVGPRTVVSSSRSPRTADGEETRVSIIGVVDIMQSILNRMAQSRPKPQSPKNPNVPPNDLDREKPPELSTTSSGFIPTTLAATTLALDANTTLENVLLKLFQDVENVKDMQCYNLEVPILPVSQFNSYLRFNACLVIFSASDCDRTKSDYIQYLSLPGRSPFSPCSEATIFTAETVKRFKKSTTIAADFPSSVPFKTYTARHPLSPKPFDESDEDYVLPEMDWASSNGNGISKPRPTKAPSIPPEFAHPDVYTPVEAISDAPLRIPYQNPDFQPCGPKCSTKDQYGVIHEACPGIITYKQCPNGSSGTMSYECISIFGGGMEGRLDFSKCTSNWILDIEKSVTQHVLMSSSEATNVLHNLEDSLKRSSNGSAKFYGHEIDGLLSVIDRVVGQTNKKNLDETEKLVNASVSIFGSLASDADTWSQLPEHERAGVATKLFNTIESTMFIVTNASEKSGIRTSGYTRTFDSSNDLKIVVGTLPRPGFGQGPATEADAAVEADLKLPGGWKGLVPGTGDIQFVRMKMGTNLVNNMIPVRSGQDNPKMINSQLNSFTVANSEGTVKLKFKGPGIRITFDHAAEAWGSEETTRVSRKLHDGEQPMSVLGSGVCVYWDTHKSNWSSDGCEVVESSRSFTVCECQHLTAFAVLMSTHKYTGRDIGLTVLTILLCSLSVIFLLTTIIILKTLRTVRNPRSSVTVHLCACLLLGNLLILTLMDRNNFALPNVLCAFTGLVTHFVFLSAFGWMAVEGYIVYKMVVDVFDTGVENKIRFRLFAYGAPCVIVAIVLVVHLFSANPSYGGDLYCWLEGSYIWAFIGPVLLVTTGNILVLVIALTKAYHKNNSTANVKQSSKKSRNMIVGTLSLTCILGITWIFGLLLTTANPHVSIVGAYLFTIFNASQGILIFIFHCWMNKQVRKAVDRRISTWTSGSYPNANSRSQPQNSTTYSAGKRTESTRGSKSSGSDRRDTLNLNPEEDVPEELDEALPKVNMATHPKVQINVQNVERIQDKAKDDDDGFSDMGSIDSDSESESDTELTKPSEPIMLKYCSTEV